MSQKVSLQFTEEMKGFFAPNSSNKNFPADKNFYLESFKEGENKKQQLDFKLTIKVADIDEFINDPQLQAEAVGKIICPELGGELPVENGVFNLFVKPESSTAINTSKEMHYLLTFKDKGGRDLTFYGFKDVEREDLTDAWSETTTLYTTIYEGLLTAPPEEQTPLYWGVLKILPEDFIQQMKTFKSEGASFPQKISAMSKFFSIFACNLWEAYAPFVFGTDQDRWDQHQITLQSHEGVRNCEYTKHDVYTDDGIRISMDRFKNKNCKNVVLLLHGLTTSTDMFIMPEHYNLTQYLIDHGFEDVWSLDWRGSGRHIYNLKPLHYTIDDVLMYDVPAAVKMIRDKTEGEVAIHVVCHCVGSISLVSSIAAGQVEGIQSVVSNSVSLTPQIRWQSRVKLTLGPTVLEHICGYPYVSPEMPFFPGPGFGKWIFWMERSIRRECKEPACHMISFMWGWGFPAAYEHKNLNPVTHRRLKDLFGGTNVHWYRHILKMVKAGQSLPFEKKEDKYDLPAGYLDNVKNVKMPPMLLVSGDQNHIFPGANKRTTERLKNDFGLSNVRYQEFKGYGHQDTLMGKNCSNEVFPSFLEFLNEHKV